MTHGLSPFRLRATFSPRPWGRSDLSPWYSREQVEAQMPDTDEPIGEAWLTGPQAVAETGQFEGMTLAEICSRSSAEMLGAWESEEEFPLLLKLLFPDDKLSVQVHPDDLLAQALGQPRGKTECWYTLAAEQGASVACGLKPGVTLEQIRASVSDHSMERLLNRVPVQVGSMVFVDAGTIHAIGPGVTLLETQQTSDTTYRMYDYGRPRELHLEQGLKAMKLQTAAGLVEPKPLGMVEGEHATGTRLIEQKYFTVDRFDVPAHRSVNRSDAAGKPHCIVALRGIAVLRTGDGHAIDLVPGTATVVPASCGAYGIEAAHEDFACVRSMP